MTNPFTQAVTTIGQTVGWKPGRPFGIYRSDRLFHQFILGQTGTGKSTLIRQMITQDIRQGEGFCLIDPHGDLARSVKPTLSGTAIYWDPASEGCPYGYNPLTYVAGVYRPLVASAIIEAFKSQWSDALGVRMEHLLRYAVLALLSRRGSSLSDIVPMCMDKGFRSQILQSVTDKEVLKFWRQEYPQMNYKNAFDGVAPIANKLGAFLSNPIVRRTLCDPEKPLRFRQIMDDGRPMIINLSKGRFGTDVSEVLGGLVLAMITQAAMSRESLNLHQRRPFFVYVDEFASFTTKTVAGMLSELRKYRVGLVLAGQYLSGIKPAILDATFGNVGSIMIFRVGANDAPLLSRQLGGLDPDSLINQSNYRMFAKVMVHGVQTKAFSAITQRA